MGFCKVVPDLWRDSDSPSYIVWVTGFQVWNATYPYFFEVGHGNKTKTTYLHKNAKLWNFFSGFGRGLWLHVKKHSLRCVAAYPLSLWSFRCEMIFYCQYHQYKVSLSDFVIQESDKYNFQIILGQSGNPVWQDVHTPWADQTMMWRGCTDCASTRGVRGRPIP